MIAQRVLAVLAAVFLVAAVAIATFGPQTISLGQALFLFDHDIVDKLPMWSDRTVGSWVWHSLAQPLMDRPAWLVPAGLGLVFAGLSLSLSSRNTGQRSRRRS